MSRYAVRLAVAVLVAAAVGLGVPAPAGAATCGSATGVSVVVDFNELGGGVQARCDRDGAGDTAWTQFEDVGFQLTPVQRQPGFVCRVDGLPTADQDPCVNTPPADAYWSLWWSDGKSGRWTFSSVGAASLKVPDGGYVALSWQSGDSKAPPDAAPTPHATAPSSSPSTRPSASSQPSQPSPGSGQPTPVSSAPGSPAPASDDPATTVSPSGDRARHGHPSKAAKSHDRSRSPQTSQAGERLGHVSTSAARNTAASGGSGDGVPAWLAPVVIVVLFAGAGTTAVVRRKGGGGP